MSAPRQHVADCWQSAEFFCNKLLMEFRGKDEQQVTWAKGLKVRAGL
jgi:adenylyl cyclase-associated protein